MRRLKVIVAAVWAAVRTLVFLAFGLISLVGLYRAFTVEPPTADRQAELVVLKQELTQAVLRGQELEARRQAVEFQPDARVQAMRNELGLLLPGERYYILR
jgi:hypothetical protein